MALQYKYSLDLKKETIEKNEHPLLTKTPPWSDCLSGATAVLMNGRSM